MITSRWLEHLFLDISTWNWKSNIHRDIPWPHWSLAMIVNKGTSGYWVVLWVVSIPMNPLPRWWKAFNWNGVWMHRMKADLSRLDSKGGSVALSLRNMFIFLSLSLLTQSFAEIASSGCSQIFACSIFWAHRFTYSGVMYLSQLSTGTTSQILHAWGMDQI